MKFPRFAVVLAALFVLVPVSAEEILYLMNGTTMPIKTHKIIDGMIHCDLGSDGKIAFPERNVERIENAGRDVYLGPSLKSNVAADGVQATAERDENTAYPAYGTTSGNTRRSSTNRRELLGKNGNIDQKSEVKRDEAGLAVVLPTRRHPNSAVRGMQSTGRMDLNRSRRATSRNDSSRLHNPSAPTTALGSKEVIGTVRPPRGSRSNPVEVTGLTLKDGKAPNTTPPPPPPPADDGAGSEGSEGSNNGGG